MPSYGSTALNEEADQLKQELREVRAAAGAPTPTASMTAEVPRAEQDPKLVLSRRARGRAARAAVDSAVSGQLSIDLARLGLNDADRTELAEAVQTTRAIIAEYS